MKLIRGLGALTALVGLVGGIPWMLLRYGEWPIRSLPNAEWFRRMTDSYVSDRTIVAVLTVAVWAVWAAFTYSVLAEFASAARGFHAPQISLGGPLQRFAHGLVATLLVAVSINHGAANFAYSMPTDTAPHRPNTPVATQVVTAPTMRSTVRTRVAEAPSRRASTSQVLAGATAVSAPVVVTVERNDSPWSIAETYLGEGLRWRELWDLNRGVVQADGRAWTDAQVILQGWKLTLPADATAATPEPATDSHTSIYVVVKGDTLSDIAEDELGNERLYPQIVNLSRGTEQPGGRHLTDPNLILPGWKLTLPATTHATATPPVADPTPSPIPVDVPAPTLPPPTVEPIVTTLPPPTTTVPTTTAPTVVAPITAASPTVPSPATTETPVVHSDARHTPAGKSSLALLAGVGGSLVLASGLSIRITMLRRRRMSRGGGHLRKIETRLADAQTIRRAGDVPIVRWAGQELASLVLRLDRHHLTGGPLAVELSEEAGIEILWSSPQQHAPEPWRIRDGGAAWRLAYDPDAPTPPDRLSAAIPALVTVGTRDDRQLLLDLEAFGTISVTGPDDRVDAFLRSVALELATSEDLADAYPELVGLDLPGGPHPRVSTATFDEAIATLADAKKSNLDSIATIGLDNTFLARVGEPTPLEANVVIVARDAAGCAEMLTDATPHCGIALVIGRDLPRAGCHIRISDDGTARIEPLGIEMIAIGIAADAADAIDDVFNELHQLIRSPEFSDPVPVVDAAAAHEQTDAEDDGSDATLPPVLNLGSEPARCLKPISSLLVKVLGVPSIPDRPNLGRRDVALTAFLACREGPTFGGALQDAIWEGDSIEQKTVWNIVGALRTALGKFDDGAPILPKKDRIKNTIQLDPRVTTDLAQLRDAVRGLGTMSSGEAFTQLSDALQHVNGAPFDAALFDWAHTNQLVAEASELIEQASCKLVDLALEQDMIDFAREVTRRALRSLPTTESLYRCRMNIEHRSGNTPGIRHAYDELVAKLNEYGTFPAHETTRLLERCFIGSTDRSEGPN
jgi:nucleoid-associated protein YgaU